MRANYHTHSEFCDGRTSAEAMAEAAFLLGYRVLGFSSHAPLPFPTKWNMRAERFPAYLAEIARLAGLWADRGLEILAGLEIDWLEGRSWPGLPLFESAGLDYRICAVHYIKPGPGEAFTVDGAAADFDAKIEVEAGGNGRLVYRNYYDQLAKAVLAGNFDIVAHYDLVTRNNRGGRWFDEESKDYLDAALMPTSLLGESGAVVEINIGALTRGKMKAPHPSLPILRRLREVGVPITFSADAHEASHLGANLETARELARVAGYRSVAVLTKGTWREVGIEET
jgi:histidinol-phosphatase (PHP family)